MAEQVKRVSWKGGSISDRTTCLVADNPSPMTFTGTNTWIVAEPGSGACVVVDPGPDSSRHLENIVVTCKNRKLSIAAILITHEHSDHNEVAGRLSKLSGAPIHSQNSGNLPDGALVVPETGLALSIVSLPGHSSDSVGIEVSGDKVLLTGDVIFKQSSTVICAPDGVLADYLQTLQRLKEYVTQRAIGRLLSAHGPTIDDPLACIDRAIAHRYDRLRQVQTALAAGVSPDAASVVAAVYADVDPHLRSAAQWSVQAQLKYLADTHGFLPPAIAP
ncbi:MAG: MBL fold metallo-hydrolase [Raoultibacter sp.]